MRFLRGAILLALVASVAAAGWLWRDNRRLSAELASVRAEVSRQDVSAPPAAASDPATAPRAGARRLLGALGRFRSVPRPASRQEPARPETMAERRARRQARIEGMFGRDADEPEEEYRARMVPFVESVITPFRERTAEGRRAAEAAASVTPKQSQELDAIYSDAYAEAMALTNQAIQSGELSPYQRNPAGVLSWVGGLGAVLTSAEGRVGGVLAPEQRAAMQETGFDVAEYLGANAPWETLQPPPPPPGTN